MLQVNPKFIDELTDEEQEELHESAKNMKKLVTLFEKNEVHPFSAITASLYLIQSTANEKPELKQDCSEFLDFVMSIAEVIQADINKPETLN